MPAAIRLDASQLTMWFWCSWLDKKTKNKAESSSVHKLWEKSCIIGDQNRFQNDAWNYFNHSPHGTIFNCCPPVVVDRSSAFHHHPVKWFGIHQQIPAHLTTVWTECSRCSRAWLLIFSNALFSVSCRPNVTLCYYSPVNGELQEYLWRNDSKQGVIWMDVSRSQQKYTTPHK